MIQTLFHCSAPGTPFADCLPTETEPGIFGHISGYCGVVEPQLRKALHFHCMIQLFGFSHPRDLFRDGAFVERFRRMWYYVASIVFRSTEGYAAYTHEHAAFEALQQEPLLPITPKQRGMIGKERADQSIHAQLAHAVCVRCLNRAVHRQSPNIMFRSSMAMVRLIAPTGRQ